MDQPLFTRRAYNTEVSLIFSFVELPTEKACGLAPFLLSFSSYDKKKLDRPRNIMSNACTLSKYTKTRSKSTEHKKKRTNNTRYALEN